MPSSIRTATHYSRRHFLATQSFNIGSVALAWLLHQDGVVAAPSKPPLETPTFDLNAKRPPHEPSAKAMISFFMQGGPSHIDLFDPKPELTKNHLKTYQGELKHDNGAEATSKLFASPWKFKPYGQSGIELSELVPHLGEVIDDVCLIRSMHTSVNNHGQSIFALNTGRIQAGRPALGSWLTYALGSENQNLPAYVVLSDPSGLPVEGVNNWNNGWLPSLYQGTVVRPQEPRILNLDPPPHLQGAAQRQMLDYLGNLNREHLTTHPGENDLAARLASYELAARMQTAAKEALELDEEPEAIQNLYGLNDPATRDMASRCILARRLVERGVRFVQICTGNQTWDHHGGIQQRLPEICKKIDKPCAALVKDLKQRGLLDSTLVQWGGEMGRLPVIQNEKNIGRDHNTFGFSMWMAGGGLKGGLAYGSTDEMGHRAAENPVSHSDYHATLLHLFGLDHEKLVFRRPSGVGSLVDGQKARIVSEILRRAPA